LQFIIIIIVIKNENAQITMWCKLAQGITVEGHETKAGCKT